MLRCEAYGGEAYLYQGPQILNVSLLSSQAGPILAPFLPKLFRLLMNPLHPSTPSSLSWDEGKQGTANRPIPPPMMSPGPRYLKTNGKWLTQTCSWRPTTQETWNLLPHTHTPHPLQTLAKLTLPTRQLHSISTPPCQNYYAFGLLGVACEEMNPYKISYTQGSTVLKRRHQFYKLEGAEIIYIKKLKGQKNLP